MAALIGPAVANGAAVAGRAGAGELWLGGRGSPGLSSQSRPAPAAPVLPQGLELPLVVLELRD